MGLLESILEQVVSPRTLLAGSTERVGAGRSRTILTFARPGLSSPVKHLTDPLLHDLRIAHRVTAQKAHAVGQQFDQLGVIKVRPAPVAPKVLHHWNSPV